MASPFFHFKNIHICADGRIETETGLFTSLVPTGCAFTLDAVFPSFTGNILCLQTDGYEVAYVTATGDGYFTGGLSSFGLNVNNNYITNVLDPINPQDAATKHYVDTRPDADPILCVFHANGYYRVDTDVDGVYVCPRNGVINTIVLHREIAGTSGATTVTIQLNQVDLVIVPSITVLASYGNDAQYQANVSIPVTNGDIITMNTDSVEAGDPQNMTVEIIIN